MGEREARDETSITNTECDHRKKEKRVSDYFSVVSTAEKALRYLRPQI